MQDVGSVQLRLINAPDHEAPIAVHGPQVSAVVARPGAVSRLLFAAPAGQKVFLDATS